MTELRRRRSSIIVGATRIDGLRLTFDVERNDQRDPNKGTFSVTNLSEATRTRLEARGQIVVVEAGYQNVYGAIFTGTSFRVAHARSGPDMITTIEASDGGKEVSSLVGAWSFSRGASVADAVAAVARGIGLPISSGSTITPTSPTFPNGWAFAGRAGDGLDAITKAAGLTWSVQDGQVQILVDGDGGDGVTAVVLSASTGMIGSPERVDVKDEKTREMKRRVKVRCLIQPSIRPARLVDIRSLDVPALSGIYVVKTQKITGDTHGDDWTMALELAKAAGR